MRLALDQVLTQLIIETCKCLTSVHTSTQAACSLVDTLAGGEGHVRRRGACGLRVRAPSLN